MDQTQKVQTIDHHIKSSVYLAINSNFASWVRNSLILISTGTVLINLGHFELSLATILLGVGLNIATLIVYYYRIKNIDSKKFVESEKAMFYISVVVSLILLLLFLYLAYKYRKKI